MQGRYRHWLRPNRSTRWLSFASRGLKGTSTACPWTLLPT
nr:MAG TPA: protein of unknown function (DUF4716) [Caudoviricetes sp.]